MNSIINPSKKKVKEFFHCVWSFRLKQKLIFLGFTRRGVETFQIVQFLIIGFWFNASSILAMPQLVQGIIPIIPLACVYLFLKDKRFQLKKLLTTYAKDRWTKAEDLIIVDHTLASSEGKTMDGVSYHWDHTKGRYVLGHCIVALYHLGKIRRGFINFTLSVTKRRPKGIRGRLRKEIQYLRDTPKWKLALCMLKEVKEAGNRAGTCVFDCWYCCLEFVKGLRSLGFHFVGRLSFHPKRKLLVDGCEMTAGEFFDSLTSFKRLAGESCLFYQKIISWPGFGKVKVVAVKFLKDGQKTYQRALLVTDLYDLSAGQIIKIYKKRSKIEQAFKDVKGCFALERFHLTSLRGIQNYIALSMLAYNMGRLVWKLTYEQDAIPTIVAQFRTACLFHFAINFSMKLLEKLKRDLETILLPENRIIYEAIVKQMEIVFLQVAIE